jgi:hypothetical protein
MKTGQRRRIQKESEPKDLAARFQEWQELRIRVAKAELAAARRATADGEANGDGNNQSSRKPSDRGRTS